MTITKDRVQEMLNEVFRTAQTNDASLLVEIGIRLGIREGLEVAAASLSKYKDKRENSKNIRAIHIEEK